MPTTAEYDEHPVGGFTVNDALRLDPFGNNAIVMNITGEEFRQMIIACFYADEMRFPLISGAKAEVTYTDESKRKIKDVKLFTPDGKKLDLKKIYKVVGNSYATTVSDSPRRDQGEDTNRQTADMLMKYLEKVKKINYQGVTCITHKF